MTMPQTGTYTVTVTPQALQTMTFTMAVMQNITGTITSGTTQTLNLSPLGQDARFAFTVTSGQVFTASLMGITTSPSNTTMWMGVYNPDGSYVTGAGTSTGEVLNLNLSTGSYLLWIGPETPATGTMQLSFQ